MSRKYILPALAILALFGAGCSGQKQAPPTPQVQNPAPSQQVAANQPKPSLNVRQIEPVTDDREAAVPVTTTTANEPAATSSALFTVDDTWQTYSNEALNFDFRWPAKGRYAPEWSVEFRKVDDPSIQNGCVIDQKTINSDSTYKGFCHTTSVMETDAVERTDYFSIKKGNQYVVITFFKKLYPGDKNKADSTADYESMLETIISTFKFN